MSDQSKEIDWNAEDEKCFFDAHKAFHSSRSPHVQFDSLAIDVIRKYRERIAAETSVQKLTLFLESNADESEWSLYDAMFTERNLVRTFQTSNAAADWCAANGHTCIQA